MVDWNGFKRRIEAKDLRDAPLSGVDMKSSNLNSSDLSNADMRNVILQNTNICGVLTGDEELDLAIMRHCAKNHPNDYEKIYPDK